MRHLEAGRLVGELGAVDRRAAGAVAVLVVAALQHEAFDDAVEDGALVGELAAARLVHQQPGGRREKRRGERDEADGAARRLGGQPARRH